MSWKRFSYICRQLTVGDNSNIPQQIAELNSDPKTNWYGDKYNANEIAAVLLAKISKIHSSDSANNVVKKYSQLSITANNQITKKSNNSMNYLVLIAIVFLMLSTLFQTTFIEIFSASYIENDYNFSHFKWFSEYIEEVTIGVILLMSFGLTTLFLIGDIIRYKLPNALSRVANILLPNRIVSNYQSVISMLENPLPSKLRENDSCELSKYLDALDDENYAVEWNSIFEHQQSQLIDLCEQYSQRIIAISSVGIVLVIANFIYAIYQPIMSLQGLVL